MLNFQKMKLVTVLCVALLAHVAQASFLSTIADNVDNGLRRIRFHSVPADVSGLGRFLSHGATHKTGGKGGALDYVFNGQFSGTGPDASGTGPGAAENVYWDGAANQEAFHGGMTGPWSSEAPQAVDGSAICFDKASCRTLSAGNAAWGCGYSRCYRQNPHAFSDCEPDPLKANIVYSQYCTEWNYWGSCTHYEKMPTGSNVCTGKYICEDNSMWKNCELPIKANGNYDCKDQQDDFENLINGGHCNKSKCATWIRSGFLLFSFLLMWGC
jgi:hypothetical protein